MRTKIDAFNYSLMYYELFIKCLLNTLGLKSFASIITY